MQIIAHEAVMYKQSPKQHCIVTIHYAQHANGACDVKLEKTLLTLPLQKHVHQRRIERLQPVEPEHGPAEPELIYKKNYLVRPFSLQKLNLHSHLNGLGVPVIKLEENFMLSSCCL